MKSCEPLFTKQNPFQPASRENAHYHPACNHSLSKKQKKTALSPVRFNQQSTPHLTTGDREIHRLLENRPSGVTCEQPIFAESWPSTDCESSPTTSTASNEMDTSTHTVKAGKSTFSSELGSRQEPSWAKYIDRFRHAPPRSREERQQIDFAVGEKQFPFWSISASSSPSSSTPTKTVDKDVTQPLKDDYQYPIYSPTERCQQERSLSPCRGPSNTLSESECDDIEILHLQERANRLLLREECISDGSIHVSSEGLECPDFSSPHSIEELLRRPLILGALKSTTVKANSLQAVSCQTPLHTPSLGTPQCPEEDILLQWRLRRKIEQARECSQSVQHSSLHAPIFAQQTQSINRPSASGSIYKQQSSQTEFPHTSTYPCIDAHQAEAPALCPPASGPPMFPAFVVSGSSVSQPQAIAHVPAHMHFLCDVLPCSIQSSNVGSQQGISQNIDKSHIEVGQVRGHVSESSQKTFSNETIQKHIPYSQPASSEAIEKEELSRHRRHESNKDERAGTKDTNRKQKKSRLRAHDVPGSKKRSENVPKRIIPLAEQRRQRGRQEDSSERCSDNCATPPSPIHCALGQVVSEVLLCSGDSPPAQRTPVASGSSPCPSSVPPRSSVPPQDTENTLEVISLLLQKAEDSDEKEFEDDPLLQVLRKQRTWIKDQISQVNSMLNEPLDEQQITSALERD